MTQPKITQLTPEQVELASIYREKWQKISISTELIDQQRVISILTELYSLNKLPLPKILFFSNPRKFVLEGLPNIDKKAAGNYDKLTNELYGQVLKHLNNQLEENLRQNIELYLGEPQIEIFEEKFWNLLTGQLWLQLGGSSNYPLPVIPYPPLMLWMAEISTLDFCVSVLNCIREQKEAQILQLLFQHCGWVYPLEDICLICDRPRIIKFDAEHRLHAEGEPAIQFADGYSFYAYHGHSLPEKYGVMHPHQWQSEWLLTESNAGLRRVLIQGIGYARICQELQAIELDNWQEYTLLKIDADIDAYEPPSWDRKAPPREPIYLLKMTCPSTGHIHALRVPPAMTTAREAIRWVNWDIDPETFAVQT
jgi:hypothetical protein